MFCVVFNFIWWLENNMRIVRGTYLEKYFLKIDPPPQGGSEIFGTCVINECNLFPSFGNSNSCYLRSDYKC